MFPHKYISSIKYDPLEPLQQIEDQWGLDMPESSKDRIKFLKREFKFLDIFLSLQSFTDLRDMLDVTHKVQSLFQDAAVDLKKVKKIEHVDRVTSQLQDKILMAKLEIKGVYSIPKLSADKDNIATPNFVLEFIDVVIACLGALVNIDTVVENLEDVFKELKLLRHFVCFVSDRCIEPHRQHTNFFTHILLVIGHAAMITWLYLPSNGNENQELATAEMNVLLFDLLQMKIKPIQPDVRKIYIDVLQALRPSIQSQGYPIVEIEHVADCLVSFAGTLKHYLEELPTISNPSQTVALTDQLADFREMLDLLIANLIHLSVQDLEFHLQDIETVMVYSALLVYSLFEDVALGEATLDLPGTIQRIKEVIYHIIRKEFQSNLPTIHGLGYVDFLLNNLKEFQARNSNSLDFVKTQLQIIQNELESLQPFLQSVAEEGRMNHDRLHKSVALLIGKAYEVEYIVDSCVSNKSPKSCLMLWLLDLIKEIKEEVAAVKIPEVDLVSPDTVEDTGTSDVLSALARTERINEEIVGFEDEIETLRLKLIGGPKKRDTISIVGMPGLGKTTLANRLYSDKSVVSHFDIRAYCYVSSVYSRKELLLSILATLPVSIDETSPLSKDTNDLAVMLRKILFSRRYLILIDDVWDAGAWNDLEPCFYDANNGSRILLTTRHHKVANDVKSVNPLHLRMLDDGESWKLLKEKVFGEKSCSPLLVKVGEKIARKCGGLPLSIVFVASILARSKKTEECWKRVLRSLGSKILCYPQDIIELSYKNLPYHLKSLFLYFGIFSEHQEINFSNLTFLWIGEGLLKDVKGKSLEDIAEGYLENLVESNLAMVSKRSSGGKVKVCRIHDILLHFCKERAQKEKFMQRIERCQREIYSPKQLNQCRLAFYTEVDNLVQWSVSCSLVGSALFKKASTFLKAEVFHNFKFLKVLDLESTVIHSFPTELVYLRYFAAQTDRESIVSSITNMWNLQTLIVKSLGGELVLPSTIWEMVKLRHLHIDKADFTLNSAKELLESSSKCNDLRTLSSPFFSCAEDVELILGKSPNLRELRCSFVGFRGSRFPVLDFLTRLETLKIFRAWGSISGAYIFPSNLKSLTLNSFHLGCYHSSNLATLPSLQVLKLESILFDENKWEVSNDEFPQLKVLKIVNCQFKQWIVDDAFPSLERLVLRECKYLEEIPSCFENMSSIKSIEVKYCNKAVDKSAREIRYTRVEELADSNFNVVISSRRRMRLSEEDDNTGVAAAAYDEVEDEDEEEEEEDDDDEEEEEEEEEEAADEEVFGS